MGNAWAQRGDVYGGWARLHGAATGWFHTQRMEGRWWLVDPQGQAFLSLGVNEVSLGPGPVAAGAYRKAALEQYGSPANWAQQCVSRAREWGFTTIGVHSDYVVRSQHVPYVISLDVTSALRLSEGQSFPDVFAPAFAAETQRLANRVCRPLAEDPWLIGYVTDTALAWSLGGRDSEGLLVQFLRLGDYASGRAALLGFLTDRYLDVEALNEAWHTEYGAFAEIGRVPQAGAAIPKEDEEEFARLVADQYFRVTHDAIRGVDANHLLLGCRFLAPPPKPVLEAAREYVDVIPLSGSGGSPSAATLRSIYQTAKLPLLIGEYSAWPAEGGQTKRPAEGGTAGSQEEQARRYARYLAETISLPMVIGCHWARYSDRPDDAGGGATGLVSTADEPHRAFVEAVTRAHKEAYSRHAGSKLATPPTSAKSPRRGGAR